MPVTSPVAKSSSPNEPVDELRLVPIMRGWRGKGVGGGDGGDQGGDSGGNKGGGCQGGGREGGDGGSRGGGVGGKMGLDTMTTSCAASIPVAIAIWLATLER